MAHLLIQWRGKESKWEIEVVSVLCVVSQQVALKPGAKVFILYKQSEIEARMARIIEVSGECYNIYYLYLYIFIYIYLYIFIIYYISHWKLFW